MKPSPSFSGLKIDRFLTHGLDHHGEEGLALVTAIIALALSLKMDVGAKVWRRTHNSHSYARWPAIRYRGPYLPDQ
jgi:hypothetical protein